MSVRVYKSGYHTGSFHVSLFIDKRRGRQPIKYFFFVSYGLYQAIDGKNGSPAILLYLSLLFAPQRVS